ncbi:MAG: glycosyltransferase [Holophaga sp.]|nr:glycosyltransferase [Holophaga sp.]
MGGTFFREQAQALATEGSEVTVLHPEVRYWRTPGHLWSGLFRSHCHQRGNLLEVLESGPTLSLRRRVGLVTWEIRVLLLYLRYFRRIGRPDVIHAQSAFPGACAARLLAKLLSTPLVITEHQSDYYDGAYTPWQMKALSRCFHEATAVIAVSNFLKQTLTEANLVSEAKIEVLPNPVDSLKFFPRPSIPAGDFRFLSVGSLSELKRNSDLILAFCEAFPLQESVQLDIVGEGPDFETLKELIESRGRGSQIRLLGSIPRERMPDQFRKAHAYVQASRIETFGVALAEALMTGLPVISTACGGPEDFVTPANGFLVPVGEKQAMVEALRSIRRDYSRFNRHQISTQSRDVFGIPSFVNHVMKLYTRVLGKVEAPLEFPGKETLR